MRVSNSSTPLKPKTKSRTPTRNSRRRSARPRKVLAKQKQHDANVRELVKTLLEQIRLDKEFEDIRKELSLRTDFTITDAFNTIDTDGRGYFMLDDLARCYTHY